MSGLGFLGLVVGARGRSHARVRRTDEPDRCAEHARSQAPQGPLGQAPEAKQRYGTAHQWP